MTIILAEDKALKSYLQGMKVQDEKVADRAVKVWYGYPDVEIRSQEFPFVVIDLIGIRPANDRQHSGLIVDSDLQGTISPTPGVSYTYEMPVAYDLDYQVSAYSRHPLHDRAIAFQLMQKFPSKYGFLPVPNDLGTETAYRHMFVLSITKRDTADNVTGARRLLNTVYTIRVLSEMSPVTAVGGAPQIDRVFINDPSLNDTIPTDLQIV
ncbi:MAG: hypothetical protein EB059_10575 [Alphaproteobacteria bacterium]|nr:hypothetical protein [Alphaproteobacteria bacterium]